MYIMKWTRAKEYVQIKKYSHRSFGAPGQKREKRMNNTPKAAEKYNNKLRAEKLQMLMILNFDQGFHVILTYPKDKRPETYKEAEKNLMKCLYKISRRMKSKGKKFRYIAVTEKGKRREALHHHVIVEGFTEIIDELMKVWGRHMQVVPMYKEGAYKDLAEYIVKIETKEEVLKGKSKYHRSRNLKEPVTRSKIVAGSFKEDPKIPQGYNLMPDTLVNGRNETFGVRFQHYMIEKQIVPKEKPKEPLISDENRSHKCTLWESLKKGTKKMVRKLWR